MNPRFAIFSILTVLVSICDAADMNEIADAQKKLDQLEIKLHDYRLDGPKLSPDELSEHQRLTGFLFLEDPYWRLQQELTLQINSLAKDISANPTLIEPKLFLLKEALAICIGLSELSDYSFADDDALTIRNSVMTDDTDRMRSYYEKRKRAEQGAAANP